jgi:alpha-1,3-fucosyltransferase
MRIFDGKFSFQDKKIWKLIQKKERPIAWYVSNCYTRSRRADLVKQIKNYTEVDIYGNCGSLKCPVDAQECYDLLNTKYRFYLSFENSLCPDYVTEKLYRPLTQHIIPIVFNGGNTSQFAPPKSYINANDFDTPQELVNFLNHLIENPKEYIQYFWWKKHYKIKSHPTHPYMLCDLCKKLNNPEVTEASHYYEDIKAWYNRSTCNQNAHIKF